MAGWKFHLVQLTKSFPTDFNYLGPGWNGLLLRAGVNATKHRKPRTDIIVRWPHDCLSPIMRWPQLKPRQTAWGGAFLYLEKCWNFGILRKTFISHIWNLVVLAEHWLGKPRTSKTDEFSEKFQTAFDPPLIFGKLYCGFRDKIVTKARMFIMAGLMCIIWSYFPWDACSTNVQHCNRVKIYPKKTFLYHFPGQKALFKGPNFAI